MACQPTSSRPCLVPLAEETNKRAPLATLAVGQAPALGDGLQRCNCQPHALELGRTPHPQIAVVTGGSQSIGKTIVEMLALEGASVYFCSLCEAEGDAVAAAINEQLGLERAFHTRVDVSEREALAVWINSVGEKEGRVDILVPNAAAFVFGTIDEVDDDDWDKVLGVNVKVRLRRCPVWSSRQGVSECRSRPIDSRQRRVSVVRRRATPTASS